MREGNEDGIEAKREGAVAYPLRDLRNRSKGFTVLVTDFFPCFHRGEALAPNW